MARMQKLLLAALLIAGPCAADNDETAAAELDVNSRYTIESVHLMGVASARISVPLRKELDKVVGSRYDDSALKRLADRIKGELRATDVRVKAERGAEPGHLIVSFEVKTNEQPFDLNVAKFLYQSREGWSGEGNTATTIRGNRFTFGLLSDGDDLVERFAGLRAGFERKRVGTDRLRLRFEFDSFHEQWNQATLDRSPLSGLYRSRQVFTPEATLAIAPPLELSFGASFARFQPIADAKTESSNAVVTTLRYHRRWGSARDLEQQELSGAYSLSAATGVLGTDAVFTRHFARARYFVRRHRHRVELAFLAGGLHGNAPLYERFVLGNSTTLRGWDKFALDPLGGSRVVHGSIDYQYGFLHVFYDTGAVWDRSQDREQKQSAGAGFKVEGFQLAVAFPIRAGHAEPVFYAGLNF
jgi:surface antigen Omp85-like protein